METDNPFREDFKELIIQGLSGKASDKSVTRDQSNHQGRTYTRSALDDAAINRLLGIYSESGFRAHFKRLRSDITIVNGGWFIPPFGTTDPLENTGSYITVGRPDESYKSVYSTVAEHYKGNLFLLELKASEVSKFNYPKGMIDNELYDLFNLYSFSNNDFHLESNFDPLLNTPKYTFRKTSGLNTGSLSAPTEMIAAKLIEAIIELDPDPIETMMNRVIIDRFFLTKRWRGRISDVDAIIQYEGESFFVDNKVKYLSAGMKLGQNEDHYPFFEALSEWPQCRALYVVNLHEDKGEVPGLEPTNWWFADMRRFKIGIGMEKLPGREGSSGKKSPDTILIPKKENFRKLFKEHRQ